MPAPVYLSINEFDGDGVTTQHEFAFAGGYIDRTHVKAYITDAFGIITAIPVTDGMFVTDNTLDLGVPAPVDGVTRIYRETPRDQPLLDFTDNARITAANLDLLARQTVLGVAEAFDAGAYAAANDLLGAAGVALATALQAIADAEAAVTDASNSAGLAAVSQAVATAKALEAAASAVSAAASEAAALSSRQDAEDARDIAVAAEALVTAAAAATEASALTASAAATSASVSAGVASAAAVSATNSAASAASSAGVALASAASVVTPTSYGVPVSPADGTAQLQAFISTYAGSTIDLQGAVYRVTSTLVLPTGTHITNGTIDASGLPSGGFLFYAGGALGAAVPISGTVSVTAASFTTTAAHGLVAGDLIYVGSTDAFGQGTSTSGELATVGSVSGLTVDLTNRLWGQYTTAPTLRKVSPKRAIRLRFLTLIGGGVGLNHQLFEAEHAQDVHIYGCASMNFGERHWQFRRCRDFSVIACSMRHSDSATGLAYGVVVVDGCNNGVIQGCTGLDLRHGISIGGSTGVDRFITATGNSFTGCTDAGIDTHPNAQYITIAGNTIDAGGTAGALMDGLVIQGADVTVSGNTVTGHSRNGILLQPSTVAAHVIPMYTIAGNVVRQASGSSNIGILVSSESPLSALRVSITGNTIESINTTASGILVESTAVASNGFRGITVVGNTVYARGRCVGLTTSGTKFIRSFVVSDNVLETLSIVDDVVSVSAATAGYIERGLVSGNSIYGGRYGCYGLNTSRVVANGNMIQVFATAALLGITGANNTTT